LFASALGHQACALGFKVYYSPSTNLFFAKMKLSNVDVSYLKELARMERQYLMIIDDFGIQPLAGPDQTALLEIMEDRHGKRSTIFLHRRFLLASGTWLPGNKQWLMLF